MHGFRNVGVTEAALMAVFVNDNASNASRDAPDPAALLALYEALKIPFTMR